jgi:hypothetical protein
MSDSPQCVPVDKWMTDAAKEQNEYVHAQVEALRPGCNYYPGFNQLDQFIARHYSEEATRVQELRAAAQDAFVVIESLRLAVTWELAPEIKEAIEQLSPRFIKALGAWEK